MNEMKVENKSENLKMIKSDGIIKEETFKILSTSTNHLTPKLFQPKNKIMKSIWIVFGLISTSMCFMFIFNSFKDYLEYDVVTSVRVFEEKEADFVRITICNSNPFLKKAAREKVLDSYFEIYKINESSIQFYNEKSLFDLTKDLYSYYTESFTFEEKKAMSYSFNETFISCKFGKSECSESDFEIIPTHHGICYMFNSNKKINKTVLEIGQYSGLILEMFVGTENYDPKVDFFMNQFRNSRNLKEKKRKKFIILISFIKFVFSLSFSHLFEN
jgi:hypothetical protein